MKYNKIRPTITASKICNVVKGLVSGSCIAGFCYCLHFTQIQQIAIMYLVWYISDKNQTKTARVIKGWFKYMTDFKNFPDHLIYSSRNMATSRSLSPRIPGVTLIF
jgi:hypothetical protein